MKFVRPRDAGSVERLLATLPEAPLTYGDPGATLAGSEPVGFRHDRYGTVLGRGQTTFQRAVAGLQQWQAHRIPGVRVFPDTEAIRPGTHVVVTLGTPTLALAAPCRVVGVVDEPERWGFAYGTLPGHPEEGEEAFVVSLSTDGTVQFGISALSRPGDVLRRAGPLARLMQRAGTHAYLGALRRYVRAGGPGS